jgi:hypothetical protein
VTDVAGVLLRFSLASSAISALGLYSGHSFGADDSNQVQTVVVMANRVGAKSEFLALKVRLDFEGFYYRYKNIRAQEIVSGATHISNDQCGRSDDSRRRS